MKIMKDEKKHHGAVDESSLEQQFRKLDTDYFCFMKFLEPYTYSASGPLWHGRQAGRLAGIGKSMSGGLLGKTGNWEPGDHMQ